MEEQKILNLVVRKSNWLAHIVYWLFAASLLFYVFSNRNYDYTIRLALVGYITVISYLVTSFVNKFLITKYLFSGRLLLFGYLIIGILIVTVWLIVYSTVLALIYSMAYLPNLILPKKDDIVILLSGSFLIIIFAAVIHFIKESYRRFLEKDIVERQKQQTELKLKEANLKLLQGQIHPHFLFNMLNNLYGLVKENADSSREVIVKLSDLLDYMLYECDKPLVSLQREIDFIRNYIELERIRHDESFNVKFEVENIDNNLLIAPLILFPYVENAFKHGFHDPKQSFIDIKLNILDSYLQFSIQNNISDIRHDKYLKQEGKGIGLRNSKERLGLVYKDKYDLQLTEEQNIFRVNLKLSLRNE